jgi:DNA mismatch endonuclease (patch repair protein)
MDVHTKEQRSYNMSRVRSENTKPELIMFELLKQHDYKFRKHYNISGKPDIVFPKLKVAVFIDGEFWHGKNFPSWESKMSVFWKKKIMDNIKRDRKTERILRKEGWHVLRFWDKKVVRLPETSLLRLKKFLSKQETK